VVGVCSAAAQQPAASQLTPPTLRPAPLATPRGIALPQSAPQTAPTGADAISVKIRNVSFEGGFEELAESIAPLTAAVTGPRVSVAQLYTYASAVEQAYARAGYVLVRIIVPVQTLLEGGTFKLVVLDGFVEAVDVAKLPGRVRAVVAERTALLVKQRHIKLEEIERRVLLAGDVAGVRLRSTLARGQESGGTRLVLEGTHQLFQTTLTTDNRLTPANGHWQSGAAVAINSPFGLGEQLYANITRSDSPDTWRTSSPLRMWGVGTVLPLGADGLIVNPEYVGSQLYPTLPPGSLTTIDSFTRVAVRASYPFVRTRARNVSGSLAYEHIEQTSEAPEFEQVLSHDRYGVIRLSGDASWVLPWDSPVSLQATFSHGIGGRSVADAQADGIPLSRLGAGPNFNKLLAEARYAHTLPLGARLDVSTRAQAALSGALLKSEQFSLDSADILTGFDSGVIVVDRGVTVRAELGRPIAIDFGDWAKSMTPYVFAAAGRGWLAEPTAVERERSDAQSFGVGVRTAIQGSEGWPAGSLQAEIARRHFEESERGKGLRATISAATRF
jgi:hemolysin activation/secretion protein